MHLCTVETVLTASPDAMVSDCQHGRSKTFLFAGVAVDSKNAAFWLVRRRESLCGSASCSRRLRCKWCVDEAVETRGSIGLEGGASYAVVS